MLASWVTELSELWIYILNLTPLVSFLSYFYMCGSGSVFWIRIRIHKAPEYVSGSGYGSTTLWITPTRISNFCFSGKIRLHRIICFLSLPAGYAGSHLRHGCSSKQRKGLSFLLFLIRFHFIRVRIQPKVWIRIRLQHFSLPCLIFK